MITVSDLIAELSKEDPDRKIRKSTIIFEDHDRMISVKDRIIESFLQTERRAKKDK